MTGQPIDIEMAMQWAVDELAAEASADDPLGYGSGSGFEALERYGCFIDGSGTPWDQVAITKAHPDAVALVHAAEALGKKTVDLSPDLDGLLGHLAAYAPERAEGRDMIRICTIQQGTDVLVWARMKRRPDWQPVVSLAMIPDPKPLHRVKPLAYGRGAHGRWLTGAHCPVRLEPAIGEIMATRARYVLWQRGLAKLASNFFEINGRRVIGPAADETPWLERTEPERRVLSAAA